MVMSQERERAFEDAEAMLRLEGLDPTGEAHYEAIKDRVIAGELSFNEARVLVLAHYSALA